MSLTCATHYAWGLHRGRGALFTKDGCYLDGAAARENFLRIALVKDKASWSRMLFAGKLAIDDTPLFEPPGA